MKAPTQVEAFAIRGHMRREWEDTLLAAFERAFDEVAAGGETIHLDKLELDLRVNSEAQLDTDLPELLYQQLMDQLRGLVDQALAASAAGTAPMPDAGTEPGGMRIVTDDESWFEMLMYYVRNGSLPWNAIGLEDVSMAAGLRAAFMREPDRVADAISAGATVPMMFRLLQLAGDDGLAALIGALVARAAALDGIDPERILGLIRSGEGDRHTILYRAATLLADAVNAAPGEPRWLDAARDGGAVAGADDDTIPSRDDDAAARSNSGRTQMLRALDHFIQFIESGALRESLGAFLATIPEAARAAFADIPAPDSSGDGVIPRSELMRIARALAAAALRGASDGSSIADGTRIVERFLSALDADEVRSFIIAALRDIGQGWTGRAARICRSVIEAEAGSAGRPIRLRVAAAVVAASMCGAASAVVPDFASAIRAAVSPSELALLLESLAESDRVLLRGSLADRGTTPLAANDDGDRGVREEAALIRRRLAGEGTATVRRASHPAQEPPPSRRSGAMPEVMQNAGIVILHSFILPLLTNTGVVESGIAELTPQALARAAALLHYLATGREEAYEFELGLVKVLLGVAADEPLLVAEGMIGQDDRDEADAVIDAVIGHWTALKGTSREGLRGGFLQRRGLLRTEEDSWLLQVEPASFDLLLGSLPWGISIVKLPWMTKPIHVEWERP